MGRFEMVENKRRVIQGSMMKYFAYGSNMFLPKMRKAVPNNICDSS